MKHGKKSILIILFSFTLPAAAFTQSDAAASTRSPAIPPTLLRQDLLVLRDTLQKIHPGLYRYKSKTQTDHLFDSCLAGIQDSMTITDFFALTSFVIASMEDGHTNCRLPGQVMNEYMSTLKLFPAMLLFLHNKAFIFCCKQNGRLAETELLSIDHRPMDEIIQRLFHYIPSDGSIQSRKNWEMPENFHILYSLVYGVKDSFDIQCKTKTGDLINTTVKADLIKNVICPSPFKKPAKYLQLSYKPGQIAVLTIKTFFDGFLQQTGEKFDAFLDSAFRDMKERKIRRLIIDIRGNQGGNDGNGELLYAYLTSKPFYYYAAQESTTEKFTESGHPNLGRQNPKDANFSGKVFFLTDGRSFSASAEFAAVARSNKRGLFIGEETGGGYYGNTSGDEIFLDLPNTHISCRIPMIKYTSAVRAAAFPDRGVIPDYPVYPEIGDFTDHKDRQIDYALKIASRINPGLKWTGGL
jgi:hypothetical protein